MDHNCTQLQLVTVEQDGIAEGTEAASVLNMRSRSRVTSGRLGSVALDAATRSSLYVLGWNVMTASLEVR